MYCGKIFSFLMMEYFNFCCIIQSSGKIIIIIDYSLHLRPLDVFDGRSSVIPLVPENTLCGDQWGEKRKEP